MQITSSIVEVGRKSNIHFLSNDAVLNCCMKAVPEACPKCDRMFGFANFQKPKGIDGKDFGVIICECGYFDRHSNINVCP